MALITLGAMVSNISGSVGGTTFARNRGGAYARNRTVGLNPKSPFQFGVRTQFGGLAQAWGQELTEAQRQQWESYAEATPIINRVGDERKLSGINMFAGNNSLILEVGGTRVDDGPVNPGVGSTFSLGVTIDAAANTYTVTDPGGIAVLPPQGRGLLIQFSRPQSPGVNFFSGPFRKAGGFVIDDLNVLPTDEPLPFPVEAGQALFMRHTWVDLLGRGGVPQVQRFLVA